MCYIQCTCDIFSSRSMLASQSYQIEATLAREARCCIECVFLYQSLCRHFDLSLSTPKSSVLGCQVSIYTHLHVSSVLSSILGLCKNFLLNYHLPRHLFLTIRLENQKLSTPTCNLLSAFFCIQGFENSLSYHGSSPNSSICSGPSGKNFLVKSQGVFQHKISPFKI